VLDRAREATEVESQLGILKSIHDRLVNKVQFVEEEVGKEVRRS
jgi:hypothetical protein